MKKTGILLLVLFVFMALLSCSGDKEPVVETEIYFFYMELCPSCEEYVMAEELADTINILVEKNENITCEAFNIILDDDAGRMKDILTERKLADISHVLPLLLIDDTYFVGYEEISEKIDELNK